MNVSQLLANNVKSSHDHFWATVADVTDEMARWIPPGVAHPIGERMAHLAAAEDWQVHQLAQGGVPWFASSWKGKSGFEGLNLQGTLEEAQIVRVQVETLKGYIRAVFADTENFYNSLTEEDMSRAIDMSMIGIGMVPFPIWTSTFVVGHIHDIMGEISAIKGLQGAKGYPF